MAYLVSILYSAEDPDDRRLEFRCYAGCHDHHDVIVPLEATHASKGWARRNGRPICPEHRLPGDEPYPEDL